MITLTHAIQGSPAGGKEKKEEEEEEKVKVEDYICMPILKVIHLSFSQISLAR